MSEKVYCAGGGSVPTEVRRHPFPYNPNETLGSCGQCGRILKVTEHGRLRKHQERGRTTASHDKTMESLWSVAPKPEREKFSEEVQVLVTVIAKVIPGTNRHDVMDAIAFHLGVTDLNSIEADISRTKIVSAVDVTTEDTFR